MTAEPSPPGIVLDTNVCLDIFLFGDAQSAALHVAMQRGTIEAVTRADCREEWLRVLHYPQLPVTDAARPGIEAAFDALVRCLPDELATAAAPLPRCADPDDQKFLRLAADTGAAWLLSRDAAVLRLAKRTQREGLFEILAPGAWCAAWQARHATAGEPYSSKR